MIARATVPALEVLRAAGAHIEALPSPEVGYRITLSDTMPAGIVAAHHHDAPHVVLRMEDEPAYPGEGADIALPCSDRRCPECGDPTPDFE